MKNKICYGEFDNPVLADSPCNICYSKENVKELRLGSNLIALCSNCKDRTIKVLKEEDK